jgi:hypothetical protein
MRIGVRHYASTPRLALFKRGISMGAWGGLCIFDYSRFTQAVLPAFQSGELHPFIQQTLLLKQHEHPQHPGSAFRGLADLVAACDSMMTTCSLGRAFAVCDGVFTVSRPQNQPCADRWDYEDVAALFERVLTRYTVTHYTILGLAFTAVRQLFPVELDLDDRTQTLIDLLDNRCQYWAAGIGGYGEGIRGWLDPNETEQLLLGLAAFASSMDAQSGSDPPPIQPLFEHCGESTPEYATHLRRITQFMMILQQACACGHGVLWGRDLRLFYTPDRLFTAEETRPLELT